MAYEDENLLPLSALQHLVFCERQCALIYLEQLWRDNSLTLQGANLHRRTHEGKPRREFRGDLVICRALPVKSVTLGVAGVADVVEFHRSLEDRTPNTKRRSVALSGLQGWWTPFPVEYKRGKPKPGLCDRVQLCAQAICIEEMLAVCVPGGALFYGRTQHRLEVEFDDALRAATREAAGRLHALIESGVTPPATRGPGCRRCSLLTVCRPDVRSRRQSVSSYLASVLACDQDGEKDLR